MKDPVSLMRVSDQHKVLFVHVQKTAGTALLRRMKAYFGTEGVYPDDSDGILPDAVLVHELLGERFAARGDQIKVITGHFPLAVAEILPADFTTLTTP